MPNILAEAKKWNKNESYKYAYSVPAEDGAIYQNWDGSLYIGLLGLYWRFLATSYHSGIVLASNDSFIKILAVRGKWILARDGSPKAKEYPRLISFAKTLFAIDPSLRSQFETLMRKQDLISWYDFLSSLDLFITEAIIKLKAKPDDDRIGKLFQLKIEIINRIKNINEPVLGALDSVVTSDEDQNLLDEFQASLYPGELRRDEFNSAIFTYGSDNRYVRMERKLEFKIKALCEQLGNIQRELETKKSDLKRQYPNLSYETAANMVNKSDVGQKLIDEMVTQYGRIEGAENQLYDFNRINREGKFFNELYTNGIKLAKEAIKKEAGTLTKALTPKGQILENDIFYLRLIVGFGWQRHKIRYSEKSENNEDLLKIDAAQEYIKREIGISRLYLKIISYLLENNINESYKIEGNFLDISNAENCAKKIAEKFHNSVKDEFNKSLAWALTSGIIYYLNKHKKETIYLLSILPDVVIDEFTTDYNNYSFYKIDEEKPESYYSFRHIPYSHQFKYQSEFTERFVTYKKKHLNYDAKLAYKTGLLKYYTTLNDDFDAQHSFISTLFSRISWASCSLYMNRENALRIRINTKLVNNEIYRIDLGINDFNRSLISPDGGITSSQMFDEDYETIIAHQVVSYNIYSPTYDGVKESEKNSETGWVLPGHLIDKDTLLDDFLYERMKDIFYKLSDMEKQKKYRPSFWQQLAFQLVPFYEQIYHLCTDSDYKPDYLSLVFDAVDVLLTVATFGAGKVAGLYAKSVSIITKGKSLGYRGKKLAKYVFSELDDYFINALKSFPIEVIKLSYELIEPMPIGLLRTAVNLSSAGPKLTKIADDIIEHVNEKLTTLSDMFLSTSARTDFNFDDSIKSRYDWSNILTDDQKSRINNRGSFLIKNSGVDFIFQDGGYYKIRWDNQYNTWRMIDPTHQAGGHWGKTVTWNNKSKKWQIASNAKSFNSRHATRHSRGDGSALPSKTRVVIEAEKMRNNEKMFSLTRNTKGYQNSSDYIFDISVNINGIDAQSAGKLNKTSQKWSENDGGILDIHTDLLGREMELITSSAGLVHLDEGKIVLFLGQGYLSDKYRLKHIMMSAGDGRLIGINNNILNNSLSPLDEFVTPYELGYFKSTDQYLSIEGEKLFVYAGYPKEGKKSIYDLLRRNTLGAEYRCSDISLDNHSPNGAGIYTINRQENGQDMINWYIKDFNDIYEIKWNDRVHSWRLIDPKRKTEGPLVEVIDGKWRRNPESEGLRGGGKTYEEFDSEGLPKYKRVEGDTIDADYALLSVGKTSKGRKINIKYETLDGGRLIRIYNDDIKHPSRRLVFSAHGYYTDSSQLIEIPKNTIIDLMVPPDYTLRDSKLGFFISNKYDPYVSVSSEDSIFNIHRNIANNTLHQNKNDSMKEIIDFWTEKNQEAIAKSYGKLTDEQKSNLLARGKPDADKDKVVDYFYAHFEGEGARESDLNYIADLLMQHNELVDTEGFQPVDILILNRSVYSLDFIAENSINNGEDFFHLSKLFELIKDNKLLNSAAKPYDKITISACRQNMLYSDGPDYDYEAKISDIDAPGPSRINKGFDEKLTPRDKNVSISDARQCYELIKSAREEAVGKLNKAIEIINDSSPDKISKVDQAFDIFYGSHTSQRKDFINASLDKQQMFLSKLQSSSDVFYSKSLDQNAFFVTQAWATEIPKSQWTKTGIKMQANVPLLLNSKKSLNYDDAQLKDFLSTVLIRESHRATRRASDSDDLSYPVMAKSEKSIRESVNLERIEDRG